MATVAFEGYLVPEFTRVLREGASDASEKSITRLGIVFSVSESGILRALRKAENDIDRSVANTSSLI